MNMFKVHKNIVILKIDGILLLLFDLCKLIHIVVEDSGFMGDIPIFGSIILEILIIQSVDLFWVIDSKNWVTKEQGRFINLYFGIKILLLVLTYIFIYINSSRLVTILLYLTVSYYTLGIIAIIKCLKLEKD